MARTRTRTEDWAFGETEQGGAREQKSKPCVLYKLKVQDDSWVTNYTSQEIYSLVASRPFETLGLPGTKTKHHLFSRQLSGILVGLFHFSVLFGAPRDH